MIDEKRKSRAASLQNVPPIDLPKPAFTRGKSVVKALQQRRTTREIGGRRLPLQALSNLLWAACGVNRKKVQIGNCGRTAASASNSQEIDLYVALQEGTYLYDPFHHQLMPIIAADLRPLALGRGQPDSSPEAPVRLIYVVDIHKLSHTSGYQEPGLQDPEIQKSYYYVDTGMIAGNVYLLPLPQDWPPGFITAIHSGFMPN